MTRPGAQNAVLAAAGISAAAIVYSGVKRTGKANPGVRTVAAGLVVFAGLFALAQAAPDVGGGLALLLALSVAYSQLYPLSKGGKR